MDLYADYLGFTLVVVCAASRISMFMDFAKFRMFTANFWGFFQLLPSPSAFINTWGKDCLLIRSGLGGSFSSPIHLCGCQHAWNAQECLYCYPCGLHGNGMCSVVSVPLESVESPTLHQASSDSNQLEGKRCFIPTWWPGSPASLYVSTDIMCEGGSLLPIRDEHPSSLSAFSDTTPAGLSSAVGFYCPGWICLCSVWLQ